MTEKHYDFLVIFLDILLGCKRRPECVDTLIHCVSDMVHEYDEKHFAPQLTMSDEEYAKTKI